MNKDNLGKYDLKQVLRNPGLIHRIQDGLQRLEIGRQLKEVDLLTTAIVAYRDNAPDALIKILHKEDRQKVTALIGKELMKDIDEYMEGETEQTTNQ